MVWCARWGGRTFTCQDLGAAQGLPGAAAELRVDQGGPQVAPEGDHVVHVGRPRRVQPEAAQVRLTEAAAQEVVAQPGHRLGRLSRKTQRASGGGQ